MRKTLGAAGLLLGLTLGAGCGGDAADADTVPVAGVVTVNDQPAANALVTFHPAGDTKGNGGNGSTDEAGRYVILTLHGKKGLYPGKYTVTVSRRLNPDGSPPAPTEMPIESKARETLPPKYADAAKAELTAAVVAGDKKTFDFPLKTGKK